MGTEFPFEIMTNSGDGDNDDFTRFNLCLSSSAVSFQGEQEQNYFQPAQNFLVLPEQEDFCLSLIPETSWLFSLYILFLPNSFKKKFSFCFGVQLLNPPNYFYSFLLESSEDVYWANFFLLQDFILSFAFSAYLNCISGYFFSYSFHFIEFYLFFENFI